MSFVNELPVVNHNGGAPRPSSQDFPSKALE